MFRKFTTLALVVAMTGAILPRPAIADEAVPEKQSGNGRSDSMLSMTSPAGLSDSSPKPGKPDGAAKPVEAPSEEEEELSDPDSFFQQQVEDSKNSGQKKAPSTVAEETKTQSSDENAKSASVPATALQGFIDTSQEMKVPTLTALTPSLDDMRSRLQGSAANADISVVAPEDPRTVKQREVADAFNRFGTPGLLLRSQANGYWTVLDPLHGGAAEAAGIRKGDKIWAVDGRPVLDAGINMQVAYFRITGQRGQVKWFKVQRGGAFMNVPVRLAHINEVRSQKSQYIEYYWYLLYNGLVSIAEFNRLMDRVR